MELKRVTSIAMHGEKEKLAGFFCSMKLEGKKLTSPEKIYISGCNTAIL
jgi:hypothetical protein